MFANQFSILIIHRSSERRHCSKRVHITYVCWPQSRHGKNYLFTFHMCHRWWIYIHIHIFLFFLLHAPFHEQQSITDTENIKLVFCAVKDTIMQAALKEFGMAWMLFFYTFTNRKCISWLYLLIFREITGRAQSGYALGWGCNETALVANTCDL